LTGRGYLFETCGIPSGGAIDLDQTKDLCAHYVFDLSCRRLSDVASDDAEPAFGGVVAGMAQSGNNIVMDHVLSEPWRLVDLLTVIDGIRSGLRQYSFAMSITFVSERSSEMTGSS
jgi:hypothetical protein